MTRAKTRTWVIQVCRTCHRVAQWPFCEHREANGDWVATIQVRGHVPDPPKVKS